MASRSRALWALVGLIVAVDASAQTAPYQDLDNVEGPMVLLNAAPVRPMAFDANGHLWAVNLPGNTVEKFVGGTKKPVATYPVPWGPVSLALYTSTGGAAEVLVVTRNSWALTRLDAATGAILDSVALDSEPGDILVDQSSRRAFISCMGGDSVIQVDLTQYQGAFERRYHYRSHPTFQIKSPLFLSFDDQGRVLVAPLHSGNNSTTGGPDLPNSGDRVLDLYDPANAPSAITLPDEDLFRIDPNLGANGTVTAVARRMGSMLFQHGMHPDGTFWQLHTEANNKFGTNTTDTQSEPELRGRFAFNRVTRVATPFGSPTVADPATDTISLDPGAVFTPATTVAQPYSLAFHDNGKVFITGIGSDNVVVLNADGSLSKEWDLPSGAIPRAVILDPSQTVAVVYCWGTHEIKTYRWGNPGPPALVTYELGFDPTPDVIKEGREVFFDASNSADQNVSCATCHVDGGSDLMQWNLSNMPKDDKGPMLTQTLIGLDRLAPFHWRGEREFEDFNGAFDGLLGNAGPIDDGLFAKMKAFVFALKNPANPFQNRERVIDSNIHFISNFTVPNPASDAVQGQLEFRNALTFQGRFTCNRCHAQPTGTDNDTVADFAGLIPERTHLKVAPFHEMWRRQQTIVDIKFNGKFNDPSTENNHRRAFLGAGTSHSGGVPDLFRFVELVPGSPDVAAFLHQWDNGLAPAVHFVFRLNAMSAAAATTELQGFLEPQAVLRNCDIAVFGTVQVGGLPVSTRWFWDRFDTSGKPFKAEDPAIAARSLSDFLGAAGVENNLFVGLPVGTSESFAVDYDRDGLRNAVDSDPYIPSPLNASDTTPPLFANGPVIPWITTRTARIWFDTDELTTASVRYYPTGDPSADQTATSAVLGHTHALMLPGMRASSSMASPDGEFAAESVTYDIEVTIKDRSGNPTVLTLTNVATDPFILPNANFTPATNERDRVLLHEHVVGLLDMDPLTPVGNGVHVGVTIGTAFKQGGPHPKRANDRVIVGRILKTPAGQHQATVVPAGDLTAGSGTLVVAEVELSQDPTKQQLVDGPYVITTSLTTGGITGLDIDVANVASGDQVQFNIEAVVEIKDALIPTFASNVAGCSGNPGCRLTLPVGTNIAFAQWDFPATSEANTCVSQQKP